MNRVALALLVVLASFAAATGTTRADSGKRRHEIVLQYYTRQQFGVNEFANINASVAAVNGTRTGVGLGVVYAYPITSAPPNVTNATSSAGNLGFLRGTSTVASNTLAATYFLVKTVVHYSDPTFKRTPGSVSNIGLNGTFSTQGEADFNNGQPWELAVVGGTGSFRNTYGYTIGRPFSRTNATSGSAIVVTAYETHLWI